MQTMIFVEKGLFSLVTKTCACLGSIYKYVMLAYLLWALSLFPTGLRAHLLFFHQLGTGHPVL